jgi:hypothetical protein
VDRAKSGSIRLFTVNIIVKSLYRGNRERKKTNESSLKLEKYGKSEEFWFWRGAGY